MKTLQELVEHHGGIRPAAKALAIPESTLRGRLKQLEMQVEAPEPELLPVEKLIERRKEQYQQKKRHELQRNLIPVKVKIDGPIGILHFGDPHVDDDGTDLSQLEAHMRLCQETEGLYGANIGDSQNNWVGRLGRLYGEQSTSAAESWQLAEWFLKNTPWLYLIGGNHDAWSGAGDPIRWIVGQAGVLYQSSEVRLNLCFPNKQEVRINARHDFSGHSIYNPAHGVTKALHFGVRDHIAICGHKHTSGYGVIKDPESGITMHAVQVASYKVYDRYARERGFRDQHLSPCAVTVIDPALPATHPDLVKVFWDAHEGAEYLTYKRSRK
ncbi:hypothetical protein C7410_115186 [Paraburkholderia silvatlantica]|uniref:Calcineurin-like phosphoesterase family protein n=1 Tax=Paraburkholderia silvatlantica TaxID=321895 RepID=A0A2V4TT73_9BURK|nr:hypothetical protein [Paraburkholderia silvatlantica]PYE21343.1 hypothetical protein C7410_115186 [Paraburkholderia silvatlantica]